MSDELLYTQEDIDEWMRTCEELQEKIAEQKAEIEQLTEEKQSLIGRNAGLCYSNNQLKDKTVKLQKQVNILNDRLAKTTEAIDTALYVSDAYQEKVKQAVKDTAKEIFTELLKDENVKINVSLGQWGEPYNVACVNFDTIEELAKERYGVEVE
jgi:predicted nuclease with TOPRIM domain